MSWIDTYSGVRLDLWNPQQDSILLEDIAQALSLICRFGGHCMGFYSVSQHSVLASQLDVVPAELKLTALLHDAAEAYIGDLCRPVKRELPRFSEMEDGIMTAIASKFEIVYPFPDVIKTADNIMLATERRDIMVETDHPWEIDGIEPMDSSIIPWNSDWSRVAFLREYEKLKAA